MFLNLPFKCKHQALFSTAKYTCFKNIFPTFTIEFKMQNLDSSKCENDGHFRIHISKLDFMF